MVYVISALSMFILSGVVTSSSSEGLISTKHVYRPLARLNPVCSGVRLVRSYCQALIRRTNVQLQLCRYWRGIVSLSIIMLGVACGRRAPKRMALVL